MTIHYKFNKKLNPYSIFFYFVANSIKMFKKVLLGLILVISLLTITVFVGYHSLKPTYKGTLKIDGLASEVEIIFDTFGVPHITAESEEDAHFALGYVHAQDRLFQMEMLRRVSSGRLSEVFGEELLETDTFFRTLGISLQAEEAIEQFWTNEQNEPWQVNTLAYIKGVNQFMENGPKPIEFHLLSIPVEPYTLQDVYLTTGFMAFGFAEGFREDPLVSTLMNTLGNDYLKDLIIDWEELAEKIPVFDPAMAENLLSISTHTQQILDNLPVAPWLGSNSWVIGPSKTAGGKVLFANDTHMGFSQPSVWYEAHIEAPGLSSYGNYAAGFPFPLLGHNRFMAVGLTMFENDDTDFYIEKPVAENPNQYWYGEEKLSFTSRTEIISVKDGDDISFEVRSSKHGPIINAVIPQIAAIYTQPVAVSWSYLQLPNQNLEATYNIIKASTMNEVKNGASMINSPGLNIMYGDVDGNIAWWTTAKLWQRPEGQSGKLFLDGSDPAQEPVGFLPFEMNPHAENPPWGYVYSANNQPEGMDGNLYPGYYVPENRAKRITQLIEEENEWTIEKMKTMINDVYAAEDLHISKILIPLLMETKLSANEMSVLSLLKNWDGNYSINSQGAVIIQKWIYLIQKYAFEDEMGQKLFGTYIGSHLQKRSTRVFMENDTSIWWNNVNSNTQENRNEIVSKAFSETCAALEIQLGRDTDKWTWGAVHSVEHPHPFGENERLRKYFNVGPIALKGGNEVINNVGFKPDSSGYYTATFGPAMRIIIDMGQIQKSWSVQPTGQSGNLLSEHYSDQAQMYANGAFRWQLMDKADIQQNRKSKLLLIPSK